MEITFPFAAETLGFKSFAPAYLSPQASGKNLLIGANFASAASGYDEKAAILNVSWERISFAHTQANSYL